MNLGCARNDPTTLRRPPLVKLLDELSEDDQATAWAEIQALMVVGVA
jgi:hypothetical protein